MGAAVALVVSAGLIAATVLWITMPSPDLRPYVDLTIVDRDPRVLVDRALADAAVKLPGWVPRTGNTEVALIEAMALVVAELVYALNRLTGATVQVVLRLFGIDRSLGVAPTTTVTFTLGDTLGHTIPVGTRVRLDVGGGLDPLIFTTDLALVVAPGSSTGTVAATATAPTDTANGTPAATALDVLDTGLAFVSTAATASTVGGGALPESDAAWLDRAVQRLLRLSDSLVLPEHFTAFALENPAVYRATTIDNYDPGVGPVGSNFGHVTVAVSAAGGVALSAGAKAALEADMEAKTVSDLDVHVIDPTVTAVTVTATVLRLPGFDDATVKANVEAALRAYLNPDTWEWGATVYRNELIPVIDAAEGVDRVVTLAAPAADLALTGAAPLADFAEPPTSVITVNAP